MGNKGSKEEKQRMVPKKKPKRNNVTAGSSGNRSGNSQAEGIGRVSSIMTAANRALVKNDGYADIPDVPQSGPK